MAFDDDNAIIDEMKQRYYKLYFQLKEMQLTLDELEIPKDRSKWLSGWTIARAELIDLPTFSHEKLEQKVEDQIRRLTL